MADHVVTFIGENENGILAELNGGYMRQLEPMGLRGHVIDLHEPNWADRLLPLAREGIRLAWGSAGIGATLSAGDGNLWDMLQVPFVSVLADTPCQLPVNHRVASRWVANGYLMEDWLGVQRRLIRSPQISALLPFAVLPNPFRERTPWARRPHRMVFVKTGEDPARRRAGWEGWPAGLRRALHDASEEAARRPTGDITDLVIEATRANGLHLEERLEILFALTYEVDQHTRALRSNAFARALLPLGALVIGRGWDHLDAAGARATLRPAIHAAELPGLYADTQYLVSTTPNFGGGVHERVVGGFAARACVVSDSNEYMRARFPNLGAFHGLDWTAPDLSERIAAIFHNSADRDADAAAGLAVAERDFAPGIFLQALVELADLVRAGNRLERFPA
ncbi:hypothetical protein [Roseomonas populi]|uniref:Glycosyltransferase family 1 protein n=1 Tax=Roseomonas populi TaxID=3121582 RepID=A0ABT1X159_9PROT|nr:hypothetical protein [Roseomonas pecuniae]MCR0980912.1 hypothetical protein [Roseomonas pecuniae]